MAERDPRRWLAALRGGHDQLAALVDPLTSDEVVAPSMASEWSIAQVLSHLGSQAEIFSGFLTAALEHQPLPGPEAFAPVWDVWNARTPEEQVADAVHADEAFVRQLEGLSEGQLAEVHFAMFGRELDIVGFMGMRLGELALHTWDVAAALDPGATLPSDAVELLIDNGNLAEIVGRAGKAPGAVIELRVLTTAPDRQLELVVKDDVRLGPPEGDTPRDVLRLPAEAFVRLVYGRLDDAHAPAVELDAGDLTLDDLRAVFPGV